MKGQCPDCGRGAAERPLMASGLCPHHHELRRWGPHRRDPWRSLNDEVIPGDEAGVGAVQRPAIEEARALARREAMVQAKERARARREEGRGR